MEMFSNISIPEIVADAHKICLETAVNVLNIRGAPPGITSLGKALENLANTLRKLDFALQRSDKPNIELKNQDAKGVLLGALRGCATVHEAISIFVTGHSSKTSTPNLRTYCEDEDEHGWDEGCLCGITRQIEAYKQSIDRVVLIAL